MKPYMNAKFLISAEKLSQCPEYTLPEFPLLGRSNVGKSSFINGLANNKKLAKTSNVPGKTRLINFFNFSDEFMIADLPGYGYAKVPFSERTRWSDLMESYFGSGRNIKMVFQLIDMRHPATDFDISMLEFLSHYEIPYTVVLTKSDKLNKSETEQRLSLIWEELGDLAEEVEIIPFSAQNGQGAERIREIISELSE